MQMDLMEYQAKELFKKTGIPVPVNFTISGICDLDNSVNISFPVVVKAQVLTGGRFKAGGIKVAENKSELKEAAKVILNMKIHGHVTEKVMIEEKEEIKQELYLSVILDRNIKKHVIIFSLYGGVDIEQTAKNDPGFIYKIEIDPLLGFSDSDGLYLSKKAKLTFEQSKQFIGLIRNLYSLCISHGCMLAEINPLAIDADDNLIALDAKMTIDDSIIPRLPEIDEIRSSMPKLELVKEALMYNFLYIPCDDTGSVVVMSNGSGMLMSCIDHIIKQGMAVSAVLDLGGGATAEYIKHAVRILYSTPGAAILFINIFGGITRCDEVAGGIRSAIEDLEIKRPVIVRIEGTNKELGYEILTGVPSIIIVNGLEEGVKKIIEAGCKD